MTISSLNHNQPREVAIVILNYNGKHFLEQFLGGIKSSSNGHPIFIADNASSDDSVAYLRHKHPEISIVQLEQNYGFSEGYNKALKEIDATYYVILNSDVEVTPGWIDPLLERLKKHPEIAACQPKIRSFHQKEFFEYAGAAGGFIDQLGYPFCRGRLFQTLEKDEGQYEEPVEIFWATGACLFIRSNVFHEVGGFDGQYFAHMEEIDLCWRIQSAGLKVYYEPKSVVYHVGGGTLPKENPRKTYLNFRNSLATLYKNSPSKGLWKKMMWRILLDGVAASKFWLMDGRQSFRAVVRAYWDFYRNLSSYRGARKKCLEQAKHEVKHPYRKFIVVDYYLRGKRKFNELTMRP